MKSGQLDRPVTMAVLVTIVIAERSFVGPQVFAFFSTDAADSYWRLLPLLSLPRLLLGLCAGIVLAVVDSRAMRFAALGVYAVLLLWAFARGETYVLWSDPHAVGQALVPYAAGLVGMGLGFALRRLIRRGLNL